MALVLDATVGGANANTYLTLVEAETYFEKRLNSDNWNSASDAVKNQALANATMRLDHEFFNGVRAENDTQALKWPREGVVDSDGVEISSTIIPQRIKDATCELAVAMLDADLQTENALKDFEKLKVGPIDLTPRAGVKNKLPEEVVRLIAIFQTENRGNRLVRG